MSDMTLAQACAETKKFGRMLKGLEQLAGVATALESADQAVSDRRRQEAELLAKIASAQTELDAVQQAIPAAREQAEQIVKAAQADASKALEEARAQAAKLLEEARAEEATARDNAKSVIARANAAERRLTTAQQELAAVETRLEQAKAEGRKIFGS